MFAALSEDWGGCAISELSKIHKKSRLHQCQLLFDDYYQTLSASTQSFAGLPEIKSAFSLHRQSFAEL
jgi:hypothetical protein